MEKMVDIIIPAYKAQDTILRTLSSIAMQLNKDELTVTIVNDGDKNDYSFFVNMFKDVLDIREIGYEVNRGPGYARQYGIDNTHCPYISFIDADDTFYEACSVSLLLKCISETKSKIVISPFVYVYDNLSQEVKEANLIWVFGHIYERRFINKHNIRFTSTRANEDVGFNSQCQLIANHEIGEEGGHILPIVTYEWHYNQVSITRRGNEEYEYGICTPGYIYNLHNSYNVARREGVQIQEMASNILDTAFSCFIYYNVALAKNMPKETLAAIEELSRKFYYDYYEKAKKYVSEMDYNQLYTNAYAGKMVHTQGIIFQQTLTQFIDLMFSKEPDESTYEQLEYNVQNIAEQL